MEEKEIIKGCLENNKESRKALYEKFYGRMFGICLRYSGGEAEAHDMLQEGFLKMYKNLRSYKENESLESWVKKYTIDVCINHIRSDKDKRLIVSTVHENKGVIKTVSNEMSDDDILAHIQREDILRAIQELSSGYRIVFNLFLVDGYSQSKISEMLNISEDTTKVNFEKSRFAETKDALGWAA